MENWKRQVNNIANKWDKKADPQESSLEEERDLVKQDLSMHIDPSQFKQWYTRNKHPLGIEMKVNKEAGQILKPFTLNNISSAIQSYDGRKFVLAEVDGATLPFYSSSNGTGGKTEGEWYPFYGFSEDGWVMKDGHSEDDEWVYNREADPEMQERIKETAKFLSKNIILPLNPTDWIENLADYFSYQEIDEKVSRKEINNALGLPKDFDTKGINTDSGFDKLKEIKRFILQKNK